MLIRLTIALAITISAISQGAWAQERTATRHDFVAPDVGTARVLVYRPHVAVGAQSTGGMFEPRSDWTDQAHEQLNFALQQAQDRIGAVVVKPPEMTADQAQLLNQYQLLFETVANSVIEYQFFVGNRLETKKRDNRNDEFDWSLGPGVADLPGATQADYVLFLNTTDHYGSTGRKLLQFAAAVAGVGVTSGLHAGYAGLVDLRTGNVLWLNADKAMGGDVRTAEGAEKRMSQLLEEFPLGFEEQGE